MYRHNRTSGVRRCCQSTTNRRLLCRDVHSRGARNGQGLLPQRASRSVLPDALRQPIGYTKTIKRTRLDARAPRHSGNPSWYEQNKLHYAKGILLAFDDNGHPHHHHQVHNLCPKPPGIAVTHKSLDAVPGYSASHGAVRRHLWTHLGLQGRAIASSWLSPTALPSSPSVSPYCEFRPFPWCQPSTTRGCPPPSPRTGSCRTKGPSSGRTSSSL